MSSRNVTKNRREKAPAPAERSAHRAAKRVLDILEFLPRAMDGFTLTQLSLTLHVPKSSLLALLTTLTDRGYLEHHGGIYRCGPKAMEIGLAAPYQPDLARVTGPALHALAEQTGETVFLGVLVRTGAEGRDVPEVVYVDKVESRQRIRYTASLGERRPLHCTAPGLAIFAFLPEPERARLLDTLALPAFTERTVTDRRLLRHRLDDVRRTGVAINIDGFIAGASGIAAPIFDRQGAPVATCVVVGPTSRLIAHKDDVGRLVRAAAEAASRKLGFQPTSPSARRGRTAEARGSTRAPRTTRSDGRRTP